MLSKLSPIDRLPIAYPQKRVEVAGPTRIGIVGCGNVLTAHLHAFKTLQEHRVRLVPSYALGWMLNLSNALIAIKGASRPEFTS